MGCSPFTSLYTLLSFNDLRLNNTRVYALFDLLLLLNYIHAPPEAISNAVVGDPVEFPLYLPPDKKFFYLVISGERIDTLVISLPTVLADWGGLYVEIYDIDQLCKTLTEAAFTAWRTEERIRPPVVFTPAGAVGYGQAAPRVMVLPDSGLYVRLVPATGKEVVLEKMGFTDINRSSNPTTLRPSPDFDYNLILDSLSTTPEQTAFAVVHIKVLPPPDIEQEKTDQKAASGTSTFAELSYSPVRLMYKAAIARKNPDSPVSFSSILDYRIGLDSLVAADGTVCLETAADVPAGDSIIVFVTKTQEISLRTFKCTNLGVSDLFLPNQNSTYTPDIKHFDKPYIINACIEKVSETEHYVVWDSLYAAEYYLFNELVDTYIRGEPCTLYTSKWPVSDLNAERIIYYITACGKGGWIVNTSSMYHYLPKEGIFGVGYPPE